MAINDITFKWGHSKELTNVSELKNEELKHVVDPYYACIEVEGGKRLPIPMAIDQRNKHALAFMRKWVGLQTTPELKRWALWNKWEGSIRDFFPAVMMEDHDKKWVLHSH